MLGLFVKIGKKKLRMKEKLKASGTAKWYMSEWYKKQDLKKQSRSDVNKPILNPPNE